MAKQNQKILIKMKRNVNCTLEEDLNFMINAEIYILLSVWISTALEALMLRDVKSNMNVISDIKKYGSIITVIMNVMRATGIYFYNHQE